MDSETRSYEIAGRIWETKEKVTQAWTGLKKLQNCRQFLVEERKMVAVYCTRELKRYREVT